MEYEVSLQTISWFNGRRSDATLEISPKWQRRAVWMEKERSELISTICSKLPFPEVYIQVVTDPKTGLQRHVVVDGQQRITSILMFIDNEVSLPENDPWFGKYFKDFDATEREKFWDYKIVVRNLRKTNDAEIRDLFERLNTNNYSLTDQEIRNAKYQGAFKKLAERLADNSIFQEIGLFSARDIRRMLDIEFVSELLVLEIGGISNKKDLLDDYYYRYEEELPSEKDYETRFMSAISLIWSISNEINRPLFKAKTHFFTLFGCALKYIEVAKKFTFTKPVEVMTEITVFLNSVRVKEKRDMTELEREYFESYQRAATDKSRREKRQEILFAIIQKVEGI